MRRSKLALASWLPLVVGLGALGAGAGHEDVGVSVVARDLAGTVLLEVSLKCDNTLEWCTRYAGDPITLKHGCALSQEIMQEIKGPSSGSSEGKTDGPVHGEPLLYHLLYGRSGPRHSCHCPIYPSLPIFGCCFDDGSILVLRLPEGMEQTVVTAGYRGKTIPLDSLSVVRAASLQMQGEEPALKLCQMQSEFLVAYQDNLSLVCADDSSKTRALESAAAVVEILLERYKERRGQYCHTLCQLYAGPAAIVRAIPRNPFTPELNLCATEYLTQPPKGHLLYFPEIAGHGSDSELVVGYWLAILGEGKPAAPAQPLPASEPMPQRATKWFEVHPTQE